MNEKPVETLSTADAEAALLGALLRNPSGLEQARDIVKADDFSMLRYGWIYDAMTALYSRRAAVDVVTVEAELRDKKRLEDIGGPSAIIGLTAFFEGSSLHVVDYAYIVQRGAIRRRVADFADELRRAAYGMGEDEARPIADILTDAQLTISGLAQNLEADNWQHAGAVAGEAYEMIADMATRRAAGMDTDVNGILTGLEVIDRATRGLKPGQLTYIGARPGMGKTWLLLQTALTAARAGYSVAFFSLEMSADELIYRLYSLMTEINSEKIASADLTDEELKKLTAAEMELESLPLYFDDSGYQTPTTFRRRAAKLAARYGLDLMIVDYVQLGSSDGEGKRPDNYQRVSEISRMLKMMSKRDSLNCHVMAAVQLSRAVELRADKRPMMSDMRDSGQLEQDADYILFLYRDVVYNVGADPNVADVIIGKNRHGRITGIFSVFYNSITPLFSNLFTRKLTEVMNTRLETGLR